MLSDRFSSLFKDSFITEYLKTNNAIVMPSINSSLKSILLIDLDQLPKTPINFAEVLIRWIISVNKPRIDKGLDIVITYQIIKQCPIWQVIDMPIKQMRMTQESINKNKGPTPARKTVKMGSINKSSR